MKENQQEFKKLGDGKTPRTNPRARSKDLLPLSFLGVSAHYRLQGCFPYGELDVTGLTGYRWFFLYPASVDHLVWFFVLHTSVFHRKPDIQFQISDSNGNSILTCGMNWSILAGWEKGQVTPEWYPVPIRFKGYIDEPGSYDVKVTIDDEIHTVGSIVF